MPVYLLIAPAVVFLAALLAWMLYEARLFQISRHRIRLKKPAGAFRVLHLSDIHFAWRNRAMDAFFDRLGSEQVDFIFITGDIIDSEEGIPLAEENLKKLRAAYGIYAVLGNHDHYYYGIPDMIIHSFPGQKLPARKHPVDRLKEALARAGVRVLGNETVVVNMNGDDLLIHGLDDAVTGRANLRTAMQNFDPKKINILLTHTIDVFLEIGEGEIDLSLSGHSHGGQIRLPGLGPLVTHTMMGKEYADGVFPHKGAVCSVSRGIGHSRFAPVRLLCRPEAVLLEVEDLRG